MSAIAKVDEAVMKYLTKEAERLGFRLGQWTIRLAKQEVRAVAKAVEVRLAEALLDVEPEKVEGGSYERRAWLKAVLSVLVLLRFDRDAEAFKAVVASEEAPQEICRSSLSLALCPIDVTLSPIALCTGMRRSMRPLIALRAHQYVRPAERQPMRAG